MIRFLTIDKFIFWNLIRDFFISFFIIFFLGSSVDIFLNLDEFIKSASLSTHGSNSRIIWIFNFLKILISFQGPRGLELFSQFNSFFFLIAMAFTYYRMYRHKEIIAILASGVSLWRVGRSSFLAVIFLISIQFINQEIVLPNFAPSLLRGHAEVGRQIGNSFPLEFVLDENRNALLSPSYDPDSQSMESPVFVIRDKDGTAKSRINGSLAYWDTAEKKWFLESGKSIIFTFEQSLVASNNEINSIVQEAYFLPTSLTPDDLLAHEHSKYLTYLSLRQLFRMLYGPNDIVSYDILEIILARFSGYLLDILIVALVLPNFLLRGPSENLFLNTLSAFSFGFLVLLGSLAGRLIPSEWFSPALTAFIPVLLLMPLAVHRVLFMRT